MHSMGPVKLLQNGERPHGLRSKEHRIAQNAGGAGGGGVSFPTELRGALKEL